MKIRIPVLFVLLAIVSLVGGRVWARGARGWQQGVRYEIEAKLDTSGKRLDSRMLLTYKNNSPDTISRVYLQVPANAFHNEENTAVREMNRFNRSGFTFSQRPEPILTIQSVQFLSIGEKRSFALQAFDFSDTILDLPLPAPLPPGDTLSLGVQFTQGYESTDFTLWFPRVAVYDQGGWHAEPFHFMMESQDVWSEFAEMDVSLTVPANFVVVASGEIVGSDPVWEMVTSDTSMDSTSFVAWHDSLTKALLEAAKASGPRVVRFHADRLHNFIWSASPDFVRFGTEGEVAIDVVDRVHRNRMWAKRVLMGIDSALAYVEDHFGAYPFAHLSIVHSHHREAAQPMMLLLQDTEDFSLVYALAGVWVPGMVAVNGVKDAWMQRGVRVFMGKDNAEHRYGRYGYDIEDARKDMSFIERQYTLPTLDNLLRNVSRIYMSSGQDEPIANSIYRYKDPVGMAFNVYLKSEIFYEMLRFVVGDSAFKTALHEFVRRNAYGHAGEAELEQVFEEASGQDLDWFFDQWLHDTPVVDYQKGKVRQHQRADKSWVTEVEIRRKGDGIMPVDVQLDLGEGRKAVKRWDGKDDRGVIAFETASKPRGVKVDPDDRIMDVNLMNNGRTRLEFKPDLPLMRYVYMPGDAYLVLWRPGMGYNKQDGLRLGARTRGSYRAFYHNLTLEAAYGLRSSHIDGSIAYDHPIHHDQLLNRYYLSIRKVEGRLEADAHLAFNGSSAIISRNGRNLELGLNFSSPYDRAYTYRTVVNDTGKVRVEEWDDADVLLAYVQSEGRLGREGLGVETKFAAQTALPGGDVRFTKVNGRVELHARPAGFRFGLRGNAATSFGPDPLPLQDLFHAEGAGPRERFRNDIMKTGGDWLAFSRRYVEGGGLLRGYAGQPLPAERYGSVNLELGPSGSYAGFRLFGFYDAGRIWGRRDGGSITRSDAGLGLAFLGGDSQLFGGNLSLFSGLSARVYFPLWLSDVPAGERNARFRWYFALGKEL